MARCIVGGKILLPHVMQFWQMTQANGTCVGLQSHTVCRVWSIHVGRTMYIHMTSARAFSLLMEDGSIPMPLIKASCSNTPPSQCVVGKAPMGFMPKAERRFPPSPHGQIFTYPLCVFLGSTPLFDIPSRDLLFYVFRAHAVLQPNMLLKSHKMTMTQGIALNVKSSCSAIRA